MKEIGSVILMFLIVQALGLYVGMVMIEHEKQPEFQGMNVTPTQEPENPWNIAYFLVVVLLGAAFLIFLIKFYRGVFLFKALEGMIIFIASSIVFYVVFYSLMPPSPLVDTLSFLCALGLALLKFYKASLKNMVAVISSAGVGAIFGFSLGALPAALLIIGLSVYDFLSVFYTKHMVMMAKELGRRNLSFSVAVESSRKRKATKAEMKKLKAEAKKKGEAPKSFVEEKTHLELGTGDMAIPLMLSVAVYRVGGVGYSLAAIVGACLGLYFVLDYVLRKRAFLPALPPIAFGALLALGIVWLAGV